ncbi:hypothetical protein H0H93_008158 [Arthromyces matolae]|nr:hypothetical protein H0H93_008158 [Arthromyces matolae]
MAGLLNNPTRQHARDKLLDFARTQWAQKPQLRYSYIPHTAYWPSSLLTQFLDNFHLVRSQDSLNTILNGWEFIDVDGEALYSLVSQLNKRYDARLVKARAIKVQKAAATRARTAAAKVARTAMSYVSSAFDKENVAPASSQAIQSTPRHSSIINSIPYPTPITTPASVGQPHPIYMTPLQPPIPFSQPEPLSPPVFSYQSQYLYPYPSPYLPSPQPSPYPPQYHPHHGYQSSASTSVKHSLELQETPFWEPITKRQRRL